jgi:DNA-binding SARP family transcriptional activator
LSDAGAALFPELTPQESSREVRGLLKRLNQIVTPDNNESAQSLLRSTGRDVYTTNAAIVRCYDVQHFEQAWEHAQHGENRRAWLRKAANLHQAPYLYRNTEARIRVRRRALQQRYAAALERLVRERLHSDNPEELRRALGDAIRAIRAQPVREDLYRHAMTLYERLGMPQDALALYDLLLRRVQAISPQTEAVYREIIRRTQG